MIFDIQRFSLHDGHGVRTLVFFKGCPLRCGWCSNPESQNFRAELLFNQEKCIACRDCARDVSAPVAWDGGPVVRRDVHQFDVDRYAGICPAEALTVAGEQKTPETIIDEVEKDRVFYRGGGGVTLSGGEPFAQPEFALALLTEAKRRGLATAVETCLAVPWKNIAPALKHLDAVYADVKHVDAEKYRDWTGGDLIVALDNLGRLAAGDVPVAARVPVIPGFNDAPEELAAIARHVAGLGGVGVMHLMPFHNYGEGKYRLLGRGYAFAGVKSTPPEALAETAGDLASRFGLEVKVGG